jgi:hypothetical protein
MLLELRQKTGQAVQTQMEMDTQIAILLGDSMMVLMYSLMITLNGMTLTLMAMETSQLVT